MKSDDLLTDAEVRQAMSAAADELESQAAADEKALLDQQTQDLSSSLNAQVHADIVEQQPGVEAALPADVYQGLAPAALDVGATAYERSFQDSRRRLMSSVAQGLDGYLGTVLQSAIDAIDSLREAMDELAVESTQLAAAAATGLLTPVLESDLEDMTDGLTAARDQATVVKRELDNLGARRQAAAVAAEQRQAGDSGVRQVPGRTLVRTVSAADDPLTQTTGLVAGVPGAARATVASDQAQRLQALLRVPEVGRIGYIVICGAIGNLRRSKAARDKAQTQINKIKDIFEAMTRLLSGSFLSELQSNLETQANQSVTSALTFIQSKLDAVDQFLAAKAHRRQAFVTTVEAIGDVPATAPLADSLSSLCSLKGARFCDLKGLLEVAKSLDAQFGLQTQPSTTVGMADMTLDAAAVTSPAVAPGQEANLLLSSMSSSFVRAQFSRDDAEASYDIVDRQLRERGGVFGDGSGTLTLIGVGDQEDEILAYTQAVFDRDTLQYVFFLDQTATALRRQVIRAEADPTVIDGVDWDSGTAFPVASDTIVLRVPRTEDIVFPCDLALGYGEQQILSGVYDASAANVVRALAPAFASWMVGLPIDLGAATANGLAETRTILTVVDEQTLTYDGANVAATLPGDQGAFRLTAVANELVTAGSMSDVDGTQELKLFVLEAVTTKPHGRMVARPQRQVHVTPAVRDAFLDAGQSPADAEVRDADFLPAGSTVLSATYVDGQLDAVFTSILITAGSGSLHISGHGPFAYSAVEDLGAGQLRFTLSAPTTQVFDADVAVQVLTTSLAQQFPVQFDGAWTQQLDTWLLSLGAALERLESRMCRLLSGGSQDIASSAVALAALSTELSGVLTAARFLLVSWLVPLSLEVTEAIRALDGAGARRAARAAREGRLGELSAMSPAEGVDDGAFLIATQSYQQRLTTDEQYRLLAKSVAELQGRVESLTAAANVISDIRQAQEREVERKRQGAQRLRALQESLP